MKGGKLFILLQSLSREEFKGFRKVLQSPIYNTNERLLCLYEQLLRPYPDFDASEKAKKKLFEKIWPKEKFDAYKMHRLFSQMSQLVEAYLVLLELRNNKVEQKKALIRALGQRNLLPLFEQEGTLFQKTLMASPHRDLEHYEQQIFIHNIQYFHPLKDKYDWKDPSLDHLMDSLDRYFLLAKMRYGLSLKNRERILAKPGEWRLQQALEEGRKFMSDSLLFQLYQLAFQILETEDQMLIEAYEQLLFDHKDQLGVDHKILFFTGLNCINRLVNKGQRNFSEKALHWYRFGLDNDLLIENGQLNEVTYGNIVIFGCREKEFAWTESFIESYAHLIEESHREDVVTYHRGLWHFYQQDFEAAFSILLHYTFIPAYFLKSRLTAIRAVFEHFINQPAYYDLLIHQILAFEMAIKRGKAFSNSAKEPVLHFLRLLKALSKKIWNHQMGPQQRERLLQKLTDTPKVTARHWLEEKIKQA